MGFFTDDIEEFGPDESRSARWHYVVRALDRFVPNWFQKEGRRMAGGMGQAAARAIEALVTRSRELARERDEAMRQLAERPVTYKVPPRKHYAYNAQLALYAMAAEYMRPAKLKTDNNYPQWKDSYTKQVVDRLHSAQWKVAHGGLEASIVDAAIRAATDLLRDYHATQHEVHEQRDAAIKERDESRKALEAARKEVAALTEQRNSAMNERDNLRERIKRATNELTVNKIVPLVSSPPRVRDTGRFW